MTVIVRPDFPGADAATTAVLVVAAMVWWAVQARPRRWT